MKEATNKTQTKAKQSKKNTKRKQKGKLKRTNKI
jgi:hypothetical protein